MPYSALSNLRATRSLLDEFGLAAKYELGQNFLIDDGVVGRIVDMAGLDPSDVVLEVGPGVGTLTCALLPRVAAVVAVEADADMRGPLSVSTADYSERFALVEADAVRVTPGELAAAIEGLSSRGLQLPQGRALPNRWVANLPYAVAATLILRVFQEWAFVDDACVMVQSEVADRICAGTGTKQYGAYTAKLGLFAEVTGRFQVPPSCFYPAPHVESSVIRIARRADAPCSSAEEALWCASVIDAAFAQRRKTIRNSMSADGRWTKEQLDDAYADCGIVPTRRAETLEVAEFVELARRLAVA